MKSLKIFRPFDRHLHLRELLTLMKFVLEYSAKQFCGAVIMPNLKKPITTWQQAKTYFEEILYVAEQKGFHNFKPIMTAYLTDIIDPSNIEEGFKRGMWKAAKLYPFGATTNSDSGVTKIENIFKVLEVMQNIEMPLLVHPETDVSRYTIGFLDRERVYTDEVLTLIHREFPKLIMSVEQITTKEACQFVEDSSNNVVGTVTPQHIMYDYNAIFHGGVHPYKPGAYVENVCLPILKHPEDVAYIRNAITKGKARWKLGAGTDSAPHIEEVKLSHGSCCGCFNAPAAVELYTMVFEELGMFEDWEGIKVFEEFMSVNNLWIYGIEHSKETIELVKENQIIPELVPGNIRPFKAGQTIPWKIVS